MSGTWPDEFRLTPDDFGSLQFRDFPGGGIDDVASHLYRTEPGFMAALEADVREHGVRQPVELGAHDTIEDGHHRLAAAYRAARPVPVALYGERYPRDRAEEARWGDIRAERPQEEAARMGHRPQTWELMRSWGLLETQPEPEFEAG